MAIKEGPFMRIRELKRDAIYCVLSPPGPAGQPGNQTHVIECEGGEPPPPDGEEFTGNYHTSATLRVLCREIREYDREACEWGDTLFSDSVNRITIFESQTRTFSENSVDVFLWGDQEEKEFEGGQEIFCEFFDSFFIGATIDSLGSEIYQSALGNCVRLRSHLEDWTMQVVGSRFEAIGQTWEVAGARRTFDSTHVIIALRAGDEDES